jgi:hypothetical protein
MGAPTPVVLRVDTPSYGHVVIDASNGMRYVSDLRSFGAVYCFPKTEAAWNEVAPDGSGYALVWTTRFEVHIDQVMALASRVERTQQTA